MSKFIAAMDHSGGSTGGVLERYGQEYTEENKMDLVHEMRLRMIDSPLFNSSNIWAAIVYKDSAERNIVPVLNANGIEAYLKIDSGCAEDGTLNNFDLLAMITHAKTHGCTGTKMRSIVKDANSINAVLSQQFKIAQEIAYAGLMPIIEPEVPIDHLEKRNIESMLVTFLHHYLDVFKGKCILKLTLPEVPNMYHELTQHPKIHKVVGLSGGYSINEASNRLSLNDNMSASFSRALTQGLFYNQSNAEFNIRISQNIEQIASASS